MSITTNLANDCIYFYNALRGDSRRSRASSAADYQRLLQSGYSSVAGGVPQRARDFLNRAAPARWSELDAAATLFANQSSLGPNAQRGARDFMGVSWRVADLDRRIGGFGIGSHPLTPTTATGFDTFSPRERDRVAILAESWRMAAFHTTRHADFSRMQESMKSFYRQQASAAKILYETAAMRPSDFPTVARGVYFGHLVSRPADLWGAYKAALYPTRRQMAIRLTLSILTGHDPYSNTAPPTSAARSMMGTLWSGVTGN